MKPIIRNSGNISTGEHHNYTIDLSKGLSNLIEVAALGFTKAAISIRTVRAVGTSGNVIAQQAIIAGGPRSAFTTPVSIALSETGNQEVYDIEVSGQYMVVDLSGATLGDEGKLIIDVVLKRQ